VRRRTAAPALRQTHIRGRGLLHEADYTLGVADRPAGIGVGGFPMRASLEAVAGECNGRSSRAVPQPYGALPRPECRVLGLLPSPAGELTRSLIGQTLPCIGQALFKRLLPIHQRFPACEPVQLGGVADGDGNIRRA